MTFAHVAAVIGTWVLVFVGGIAITLSIHAPLFVGAIISLLVASVLAGKIDRYYSGIPR